MHLALPRTPHTPHAAGESYCRFPRPLPFSGFPFLVCMPPSPTSSQSPEPGHHSSPPGLPASLTESMPERLPPSCHRHALAPSPDLTTLCLTWTSAELLTGAPPTSLALLQSCWSLGSFLKSRPSHGNLSAYNF